MKYIVNIIIVILMILTVMKVTSDMASFSMKEEAMKEPIKAQTE